MRQFMDWSRTNPSRHDDYAAILVWCELKKKKNTKNSRSLALGLKYIFWINYSLKYLKEWIENGKKRSGEEVQEMEGKKKKIKRRSILRHAWCVDEKKRLKWEPWPRSHAVDTQTQAQSRSENFGAHTMNAMEWDGCLY